MNKIKQYRNCISLLVIIFLFVIISLISIYSAQNILNESGLVTKQVIWYLIGFIIVSIIILMKNNFIYEKIWFFYFIGIGLLISLLLFAPPINNAKCWFNIPGIGTFQPSEFIKIILIIVNANMINTFRENYSNPTIKEEFIFLLKILVVVGIPSILTFLEPDTGVVLIYFLITFIMLFISGIRYRWFIIIFSLLILLVGTVLTIYFVNKDIFVNIFGTDFFLRVDRLLDWSSSNGYQLEHGISAIGSGGLLGTGFNQTPVYFPEAQTDFIFAVYSSNFGYIGSLFLLILIAIFDLKLVNIAKKSKNNFNKYIIAGTIGMLLYQQLQNIGMTIGLMPITGITLPFISYGGSSLLSYMIILGIILNISIENNKYKI